MPTQDPEPHHHLLFREASREQLLRTPLFTVHRATRFPVDKESERSDFYLLENRDWVAVVPVLDLGGPKEAFLMVRQYRHGIEALTLEFPAGLVNEGESPEAAARRELEEETGHQASGLAHAATLGAAPAFMTNKCHIYVAWGLARTKDLALDPGERLEVATMPARTLMAQMGKGELQNSITAAAHYFYLRWAGIPGSP